jgi:hypothetical protein
MRRLLLTIWAIEPSQPNGFRGHSVSLRQTSSERISTRAAFKCEACFPPTLKWESALNSAGDFIPDCRKYRQTSQRFGTFGPRIPAGARVFHPSRHHADGLTVTKKFSWRVSRQQEVKFLEGTRASNDEVLPCVVHWLLQMKLISLERAKDPTNATAKPIQYSYAIRVRFDHVAKLALNE